MDRGIQSLSVNRMRAPAGEDGRQPVKGVFAGTVITGVIQSSTAMTVMTVGLVNSGVLGLRGAIGVIMGANIGTTLGNGLIALPLGPLGSAVRRHLRLGLLLREVGQARTSPWLRWDSR